MLPSLSDRERLLTHSLRIFLKGKRSAEEILHFLGTFAFSVVSQGSGLSWERVTELTQLVCEGKAPLRLLYVEDDDGVAKAMKRFFSDKAEGIEVVHVKSSQAALNEMGRESWRGCQDFDLVLTDWHLIGSDTGAPVTKEARKRGIPVRIFSGTDSEDPEIWIPKGKANSLAEVSAFFNQVREIPNSI